MTKMKDDQKITKSSPKCCHKLYLSVSLCGLFLVKSQLHKLQVTLLQFSMVDSL